MTSSPHDGDHLAMLRTSPTEGGNGSFTTLHARHDITIAFDNVSVAHRNRAILEGATGSVRGGRLTGIVSTCGSLSDKYLLRVLSAQTECNGDVMVNGSPLTVTSYKKEAVVVDEELVALDELTVIQNLRYSAELRIKNRSHIDVCVQDVVDALRLEKVANRPLMKCSTYDRRRVMVGKELVLNPTALFIENPCEGLAAHEAKQFLFCLRNIALSTGGIVAVSMFHPRLTLLHHVDDVIVLHRSEMVFSGTAADWVLATIENVRGSTDQPESALNTLYTIATTPGSNLHDSGPFERHRRITKELIHKHLQRCAEGDLEPFTPAHKRGDSPNMVVQFAYMLKYSLLQVKNNVFSYLLVLVLCLLVAILLASIYSAQDQHSQAGLQNRVGILFFLVSGAFFLNVLFVESQRRAFLSYQRHRAHGYFSVVTYFLYWLTTSATLRFTGGAGFVAVIYVLARVKATYWSLDGLHDLVTILAMTSFSTSCFIWLAVCVSPGTKFAHFLLFAIYAFSIVLAGLMLNINSLPPLVQALSFASVIRLGYESAIVSQFVDQTFGCNATQRQGDDVSSFILAAMLEDSNSTNQPSLPIPPMRSCQTGNEYIAAMGFKAEHQWQNIAVMSYITLGVVVLVFFAMLKKKPWWR